MKHDTVYMLEDGQYSDYHVIGIYSTRENAELVQKSVGGTIVERPLDPALAEINAGLRVFRVLMLRNGDTKRVEETDVDQDSIRAKSWIWARSTAPAYHGQGIPDLLWATVWAEDEKHAVKIANEIRVQMIAAGEWEVTP